jgi:aryl-alcohol dehydrogenase-like predicted oxidoreductase
MTMAWAASGMTDRNFEIVEKLRSLAAQRNRSLLELAISWLLSHQAVASVIAGATTPEQVRANAAAAGWEISKEDLAAIDRIAA